MESFFTSVSVGRKWPIQAACNMSRTQQQKHQDDQGMLLLGMQSQYNTMTTQRCLESFEKRSKSWQYVADSLVPFVRVTISARYRGIRASQARKHRKAARLKWELYSFRLPFVRPVTSTRRRRSRSCLQLCPFRSNTKTHYRVVRCVNAAVIRAATFKKEISGSR